MGTAFRFRAVLLAGLVCGGCRDKPAASIQQNWWDGGRLDPSRGAVSGRPLGVPVEQRGTCHGIDCVNEDPRLYHLVIESSDADWSVAVEEAVVGYGQSMR